MRQLVNWIVATASLGILAVAGCSDGQSILTPTEDTIVKDLSVLGRVYHDHHDHHAQGPSGWDEAIKFASEHKHDVAALERVRDAGYQVKWGMRLRDITEGTSNTVMAESGSGPKLMFDGSVQK